MASSEGGQRTSAPIAYEAGQPLVSVITPVFNAERFLERTIRSVLEQTYCNVEFILIDGNSRDGSLDIIKKYDDRVAYWLSEPDTGIYDAMNKGISRATGQWLLFLGADDYLVDGKVIQDFMQQATDNVQLLFGDVHFSDGYHFRATMDWKMLLRNRVHHQGAFYRAGLFEHFRYDTTLRLCADYELNLRLYLDHTPYKQLARVVACCQIGGASSMRDVSVAEMNMVRKRYVNYPLHLCMALTLKLKSLARALIDLVS